MNTAKRFFEKETRKHVAKVANNISEMAAHIIFRGAIHDRSKFGEIESPLFIKLTPLLKGSTYGSEEYAGFLKELKPALDNHYKENRHHPEHFKNGIKDMNLIDLCEMLADWYAAAQRHDDGDIMKSIAINQKRFGYSDDFKLMLENTVRYLGWMNE